MTLADVLRGALHVLLDFDGPVCAIYGGTSDRAVADRLRSRIESIGNELPREILDTRDPLDILRYSANLGADTLRVVEEEFIAQEIAATKTAIATPGARQALDVLAQSGRTVTIVSNNSTEAVNAYIHRSGLESRITGVIGRVRFEPRLMKPHPYLLMQAIKQRGTTPSACVMVGDSVTDIVAAHAASTASVAYANRASKHRTLALSRPDVVIESMFAIASAVV